MVRALRWPVRIRRGEEAIHVQIRNLVTMRVACIREVGSLSEVRPGFGRLLTLSFQRPGNPPRRWYWKVSVELFTREPPPPGIELTAVDGGRFAVYRLVGPHEGIGPEYRRLFDTWLPGSSETVAQRPCMELYRNTPGEMENVHLVTDLCLPLRSPQDGQASNG